jgi:hypothetical protein
MDTHATQRLRDLARRVAEVAAEPEVERRRQDWHRHNALQPGKPLLLCWPEGGWEEIGEQPGWELVCQQSPYRGWEQGLLTRLYNWEHFADDQVTDANFGISPVATTTGWGMEPEFCRPELPRGALRWEGQLKQPEDLDRLRQPETIVDWEATRRLEEQAREVFEGILEVQLRAGHWWSLSLIGELAMLRGLEQMLYDMALEPQFVHEVMSRLQAGRLRWLDSLEAQGLLALNNRNHGVGSGGLGFTEELPAPGFDPAQVRCRDMWGFAEAQEVSSISPQMFREFVVNYQLPILQRFGLNCYGCCEPLHDRFEHVLAVPRLRRISISPWCDLEISARTLQGKCVFSWKPNPARLAAISFDEELVRRETRRCLEITRAHGCVVEIILKDTHTCNHEPRRFDRWSEIAQDEAQRSVE